VPCCSNEEHLAIAVMFAGNEGIVIIKNSIFFCTTYLKNFCLHTSYMTENEALLNRDDAMPEIQKMFLQICGHLTSSDTNSYTKVVRSY
jgi:hypothetical protein